MKSKKGARLVNHIERAFRTFHEKGINEISIHYVKDWLDENTRDGMNLMRLANYLSKRPQFTLIRRERRIGTTETETYWRMPEETESAEINYTKPSPGWVIEFAKM